MNEDERIESELEEKQAGTVEIEVEVIPDDTPSEESKGKADAKKHKPSRHLKDALEQVEYFGQALSEALQGRGNVVMVRVNDEALDHLDMLTEAEITKSRSESAAFLINEGISANVELFGKISSITQKIGELREQLRQEVKLEPRDETQA